jgi:hypothetical protein
MKKVFESINFSYVHFYYLESINVSDVLNILQSTFIILKICWNVRMIDFLLL